MTFLQGALADRDKWSAVGECAIEKTMSVLGTRMHLTVGPEAAEALLVNRDRVFASGPAWSHFIGPFFHRGLMLLDCDEHLHHRRIMQAAFSNDALRRYQGVAR